MLLLSSISLRFTMDNISKNKLKLDFERKKINALEIFHTLLTTILSFVHNNPHTISKML